MNPTVALPGSMTRMGIRLSSGSRCPQSPKGPSTALIQSVFCSYGPVVVEWPEMLCACHLNIRKERIGVFTSASPRCLDLGDVDLFHRHHGLEGTLCLGATSRKRLH